MGIKIKEIKITIKTWPKSCYFDLPKILDNDNIRNKISFIKRHNNLWPERATKNKIIKLFSEYNSRDKNKSESETSAIKKHNKLLKKRTIKNEMNKLLSKQNGWTKQLMQHENW